MSSQTKARVKIGEGLADVGDLSFTRDGNRQFSAFSYSDDWRANTRRFELCPSLKLDGGPFYFKNKEGDAGGSLPPPCRDSSPDTWGRYLLERHYGAGLSDFDLVALQTDELRQGALRYTNEKDQVLQGASGSVPHIVDLEEIRAASHELETGGALRPETLEKIVGAAGGSVGARPKANVRDGDKLWIAKFTSVNDRRPVERAEVATIRLAGRCGLNVPECRLELGASESPVALFERFDRVGGTRLPYLSARAALDKPGSEPGSYTEIADFIRGWCDDVNRMLEEIYRRVAFTILVSNTDDHLKNHGFILRGSGKWELSPMFDVNPSPERQRHLETAIVEGDPFEASIERLFEAAPYFDIKEENAKAIISGVASVIRTDWKEHFRAEGVTTDQIKGYASAFEHAEMDLAMSLIRKM